MATFHSAPTTGCADPLTGRSTRESSRDFDRIVSPFIPDLLGAARKILGSEDLAWDAVQETLTRIWTRGWLPEQPRGPLLHLVRKSSLHLLRCETRRSFHEGHEAVQRSEPCCDQDPLAAFDRAEQADKVRKLICGMTAEYRAVLELYDLEGHSYASIAEQLNLPIGTVRSRLSRARTALRERLLNEVAA